MVRQVGGSVGEVIREEVRDWVNQNGRHNTRNQKSKYNMMRNVVPVASEYQTEGVGRRERWRLSGARTTVSIAIYAGRVVFLPAYRV